MWQRVFNHNHADFPECGGRGITMDPRWLSVANFIEDMGPKPPGTQLGRLDPNGPYSPGNARWLTAMESANRRRPRRWFRKPVEAQPAA
jgi:hypothetical protein